jgi:hypothetical protein
MNFSTYGRNIHYSSMGSALAKTAIHSYQATDEWKSGDHILVNTFKTICQSPCTTADEKALATMALTMGSLDDISYENSARAGYAVASAIASAVPGPVGSVIANTALEAYNEIPDDEHQDWVASDHIAGAGLKAIKDNPAVPEAQAKCAAMALELTNSERPYSDSAKMRASALQKLS